MIIDGKKEAALLREEIKKEIAALKEKQNKTPCLSVILIGDFAPSLIYVKNKEKNSREVGINSEVVRYSESVTEKEVLDKIEELNKNENVSGILVQLPLPKQINKEKIINAIHHGKMKVIKKSQTGLYLTCSGAVIKNKDLIGKWKNDKCLVDSNYKE